MGGEAFGAELGFVAIAGVDFLLHEERDVGAEGGLERHAQVGAEVVEDAFGVPGFAGDGGFGEFGVEAGVFGDAGDGYVVRVGVGGVGDEECFGAVDADEGGELVAGFEGVLDLAVGQIELRAFDVEDLGGGGGLGKADLGRAAGSGLAGGHVDEVNGMAARTKQRNGATHAEFLIVWMRADY